jgi:hypothetical protein
MVMLWNRYLSDLPQLLASQALLFSLASVARLYAAVLALFL